MYVYLIFFSILQGGNDHEIFEDSRTIGHTVVSPEDTKAKLEALMEQQHP